MDLSIQVKTNPGILTWARQEKGLALKEVAEKLDIDLSTLKKWEADGEAVPFDVLQRIAKTYKRQTATFFLPDVPPRTQAIKDCRNLAINKGHFTPDTLLAIRRTSRYLLVARSILDDHYWNNQYGWIKDFTAKPAEIDRETLRLRELLNASVDEQIKQNKSDDAFRYWRKKIEEKLGIFVFHFSMPEDELDGFSYAFDTFPYAIVINNKQASVRKIFTLFHELAHILKHNPGICRTGDSFAGGKKLGIELECNSFSGKFLIPKNHIKVTTIVDEIFEFADTFHVSGEVYLRRMVDDKLIKPDTFFKLLDQVREKSSTFVRKKQDGSPSMVIQSKSTRGNTFFNLVVDAAMTNHISFSMASDLLGLKPGSIRP